VAGHGDDGAEASSGDVHFDRGLEVTESIGIETGSRLGQ